MPLSVLSREVERPRLSPKYRYILGWALCLSGTVSVVASIVMLRSWLLAWYAFVPTSVPMMPHAAEQRLSVAAPSASFACSFEDREIQRLVYELSVQGWIQPFEVEGVACDPPGQVHRKVAFRIVEQPLDTTWLEYASDDLYPCKPPKDMGRRKDPRAWAFCYKW